MPGKRTRPILKTLHGMSLAEETLIAEGLPPIEEFGEKQLLIKCRAPSTPRQIVGFSPKVPFGNKEGNVHLPADLAHEKPCRSPKSARPASGLECLLSSSRVSGSTTLPGAVILSVDLNESVQSTKKEHVCVHGTTFGRKNESYHQHMVAFQNNLKHSHPVPILQSKNMENELCTQIQEQKIGQEKLPYDRPVALPEHNMLPLRTPRFKLVQESDVDNKVEKCDFDLSFSFPDQSKHADTMSFATLDFMKACFLCKRRLGHGLDVYMYRGDKAFCSMDCRNHQIILDERRAERREKCSSAALMSESSTKATRLNNRNRISATSTVSAA